MVVKTKPLPASTRNVVVMCKIPNGLRLQLQEKVLKEVAGRYGSEKQEFSEFRGPVYYVRGPAYPVAPPPGYPRPPIIEGGYAATAGIPADFWEKWWDQNQHADYCTPQGGAEKGMIYAEPDLESAVAAAMEHASTRSGLEPLDTATDPKTGKLLDPRSPKPINSGLQKFGPWDEAKPAGETVLTQNG